MAIEVLGKDDGSYKKATCRNCGSILRYLPVDVESYEKRDYTGDLDTYYFISCPSCKDKVYVRSQ